MQEIKSHEGSIPGSGKYPGGGNSYPLQSSAWKNFTDRGTSWTTVHGVPKSEARLCDYRALSYYFTITPHIKFLYTELSFCT